MGWMIIGICLLFFLRKGTRVFVARGVIGCTVCYILQTVFGTFGLVWPIGVNLVTAVLCGSLGIPGFILSWFLGSLWG